MRFLLARAIARRFAAGLVLCFVLIGVASAVSISNFTPTSGMPGDIVTINGNNFSTFPKVTFSGAASTISMISATNTQIRLYVPVDARTGPITVMAYSGATTTSAASFTVLAPTITSFSPPGGPAGTTVTVTGTNFQTNPGYTRIYFNGGYGITSVSSSTTATATVPSGATTGPVKVTLGMTSATSSSNFVVGAVPVTSLSPSYGPVGATVTIGGTNFAPTPAANTVTFNGVVASVSQASASSLTTTVPIGATTGPIAVVSNGVAGSGNPIFAVQGSCLSSSPFVLTVASGIAGAVYASAVDAAGNAFIADYDNGLIRKITPDRILSTFAGGTRGFNDGTGTAAQFWQPQGLAFDTSGNLYVADAGRIRKITPAAVVTTMSLSGAAMILPTGIAVDPQNNLYLADPPAGHIWKVTPAGVVSSFAGNGVETDQDGPAATAQFQNPVSIARDPSGNLYVVDSTTIRKITVSTMMVSTLAGSAGLEGSADNVTGSLARFRSPWGIVVDPATNLYVADAGNATIRKITPSGSVTTLAGSAGIIGSSAGYGSAARFNFPIGLSSDAFGNLIVPDQGNSNVRFLSMEQDTDGDGLSDCVETNTGVYVSPLNTGTDPANADTDGDGLLDGEEVNGAAGLNLPALGVNPVHKDILIEYDWFNDANGCAQHSHRPTLDIIQAVHDFFASAPVNNPDRTSGINVIQDYGQGGVFIGGNLITDPANPGGMIDGPVGYPQYNSYELANFTANRRNYFHYVLMAHQYDNHQGSTSSSGSGTISGYQTMVTLGCWAGETGGIGAAYIRNSIAHELGHNLGLQHGGDEACNYKPNYSSVMNYAFQFNGVYTDCHPLPTHNAALGYSSGGLRTLDENNLYENLGVCSSPISVDWNRNGSISSASEVYDVNYYDLEATECGATNSVLHDFNDWAHLALATVSPLRMRAPMQAQTATCAPIPAY